MSGDIPHAERLRRSRPWFKTWARHTIFGTTFSELSLRDRGLWYCLLCLACDSHEPGVIGEGIPISIGYTPEILAVKLKCDPAEIRAGLKILSEVGKITVSKESVIIVNNWNVYQSDYDRTRLMPSRTRKRTHNSTPLRTPFSTPYSQPSEDQRLQRIRGSEDQTSEKKRRRSNSNMSDLEFISALKENPAYKGIDIDRELARMDAWLSVPSNRNRKKTRRFVVAWLNRCEKPMAGETLEQRIKDEAEKAKMELRQRREGGS